jgi:hypothetical protein
VHIHRADVATLPKATVAMTWTADLDRWLQSPVSDVTIQTLFALATTQSTAAALEHSALYVRPYLDRQAKS